MLSVTKDEHDNEELIEHIEHIEQGRIEANQLNDQRPIELASLNFFSYEISSFSSFEREYQKSASETDDKWLSFALRFWLTYLSPSSNSEPLLALDSPTEIERGCQYNSV